MNHTTLVMFGVLAAAAMLVGVSTVTFAKAQNETATSVPINEGVILPDSLGKVSVQGTVTPPIPSSIDLSKLPVGQTPSLSDLGSVANGNMLVGSLTGGLTGSFSGGASASPTSSGTP